MANGQVRYSEDFPLGYGDLKLIASDGVTFCFPKPLLSWMSPVFADMLSAGGSTNGTQDVQQQVVVTEDSVTLDLLLRFFDPKKKVRPLDEPTLPPLLEAARKYQVPEVIDWWEGQVKLEEQGPSGEVTTVIKHPMLSLVLAVRYGLDNTARLALRELIKAPASKLQTTMKVESTLFSHLIQLRQARYNTIAWRILDYSTGRERCGNCIWHYPDLCNQAARLVAALANEPSLITVSRIISWPDSPCGAGHWESAKKMLDKWWIPAFSALERELPPLPNT